MRPATFRRDAYLYKTPWLAPSAAHACAVGSPDVSEADKEARLLQRARTDPTAFAQVYELC